MRTFRIVPKSENWDFPIAGPAGSFVDLVSMLVPARALMRIKGFGNYLGLVANWSHLRWDFFKNGVPIYPYFAIRTQMGYAAEPRPIGEVIIEGGCLFVIRGTQETGVADTIGCALDWQMEYQS